MEVFNDAEMRRIVALPRRPQMTPEETARASSLLTSALRAPGGTRVLKPVQAAALAEIYTYGKLFGALKPGAGKTDVTATLPTLLKAQRSLLMVPATLKQKTLDELRGLRSEWRMPQVLDMTDRSDPNQPVLRVISYEMMSTVRCATFLEEYDPDLIMADEAHALGVLKAGRTRRTMRFIHGKRRKGKKCTFVPLSGSFWSRSFRRVAHLMEAALESGSPLPTEYNALEQWCFALDRGVNAGVRLEPGALLQLCSEEQRQEGIDGVRRAVRDRILSAPGVVASKEAACGLPLILQRREVVVPDEVRTAMYNLRNDYVLPSGQSCEGGVVFWGQTMQVANGFSYYYDPPPPEEWKQAHSAWNAFVREAISNSRGTLDTPLQVWNKVEAGHFGSVPEWEAWRRIRHTFKAQPKPLWLSDYLVRDAEEWALEHGGIVWVQHSTAHTDEPDEDMIGGRFQKIPYFGAGNDAIRHHKGPCAASLRSHGTGKNLVQWHEALFMGLPSGGTTMEQVLARLHRDKQQADLVRFWFYAHSLENLNALESCLLDAAHVRDVAGEDQRILDATLLDADGGVFTVEAFGEKMTQTGDPMWCAEQE